MIVTSREVLRIHGEQQYEVSTMAVPDPRQLPPLVRISQYDSVILFTQRARAVRRDFEVTTANAPAVAEICAPLNGLPLAILKQAHYRLSPPLSWAREIVEETVPVAEPRTPADPR